MKKAFEFLELLKQNNDRNWFEAHRSDYEKAHEEIIVFADKLIENINSHDVLEPTTGKKCLYRIYRDVRFSKNKTPYKTSWDGRFRRATPTRRGGYYFHLDPEETFIVGGFWEPKSADLLHIRKQIQQDPDPLRSILNSSQFRSFFGELKGAKVKTAPRGFAIEDDNIDLIRHKGFILYHLFDPKEVFEVDFPIKMSEGFKKMRPFLDYMTDILTTDLNGYPLV